MITTLEKQKGPLQVHITTSKPKNMAKEENHRGTWLLLASGTRRDGNSARN